ncbi:MAG: hemerythrin domain-containing protein [Acidobacteriaceae bacterium]
MPIQIGAKPDSGFDHPLGMLQDCHRRIERFLHLLCLVAEQASGRSLTPEECAAISASLQYFQQAGLRHNADEEASVFPRLRAADPDHSQVNLARLERDHRRTESLHQRVESLYRRWMETSALSSQEQQALLSATSELRSIQTAHIQLEESIIFPRAAQVLDKAALTAIGSEFQARRR